ncbi:MAG: hypothetical protein FJW64_10995, partial [Actinobacteria bacterium]|nr:hypothetical protein [Actinomycetota bacterium]
MSLVDYFQTPFAYNPLTNTLVTDAAFTVHLPTDTGFTSPLAVREPDSGAAITDLRSNSVGALPEFAVANEPPQVILRSGVFTTILTSVYGAVRAAGLDPETVQKAITAGSDSKVNLEQAKLAAGEAVVARDEAKAVGNTNDTIIAGRLRDKTSQSYKELSGTIGAVTEKVFARVLLPAAYGAKGDGVADDAGALQALLNDAREGDICELGGAGIIYNIAATLLPKSGITIRSYGAAIRAMAALAGAQHIRVGTTVRGVTIDGVVFLAPQVTLSDTGTVVRV